MPHPAADQLRRQREDRRTALALEVDQARYEARLAERRYEAVDPENRLVAAELEARWNSAMQHAVDVADRLDAFDRDFTTPAIPDRAVLLSLAQDLPAVARADNGDAPQAADRTRGDSGNRGRSRSTCSHDRAIDPLGRWRAF